MIKPRWRVWKDNKQFTGFFYSEQEAIDSMNYYSAKYAGLEVREE